MIYTRNPMHPTALYLSAAWWSANGRGEAPPLPSAEDLSDIQRLRIILPQAVIAPAGWAKVKTTRIGEISALDTRTDLPETGVSIKSISRYDEQFASWIDLHRRLYVVTHSDNPVRVLPEELGRRVFAGEDLLPNGLVAAFNGEQMTGVSSLRRGKGGFELGWTGFPEESDAIAVAQLLSAVIAIAGSEDAATLEVEADDTDLPLCEALEYFDVEWKEFFETYESKIFMA